ncbi:unnamed protein product [Lampetra fluviatilis]
MGQSPFTGARRTRGSACAVCRVRDLLPRQGGGAGAGPATVAGFGSLAVGNSLQAHVIEDVPLSRKSNGGSETGSRVKAPRR